MLNIQNTDLLLNKGLINGVWCDSVSCETFDVLNPADGTVVGSAPDMNETDMENAINSAYNSFKSDEWQNKTAKDISNLLKCWFNLLVKNKNDLAQIIIAETGKPLCEAIGEFEYGVPFIEWYAEEARRINGEIIPSPSAGHKLMTIRQPIGVAGLVTPWNFPFTMITRKAGAALAAGCSVVIKPAEDTPLTALAVAKLAEEAGFPKGIINIVTTSRKNAPAVGKILCTSPKVAGISFTGSTPVGKVLYSQCAAGIKRISLELGGNAPFIVFKSANIDNAVAGAMASKFRNSGQACIAANRFLVDESVYDEFLNKLKIAVSNLKVGKGNEAGVRIGPLINKTHFIKVSGLVDDALSKKAELIIGGKQLNDIGELFYAPTILTNVTSDMKLYHQEIFGPVIAIIKFKTEKEALDIANNTNSGLGGYFYSEDVSQIFRVAEKLEVGMIGINEGLLSKVEAPFGGIKESGIGREGSKNGIEEYVDIKYLCWGSLK